MLVLVGSEKGGTGKSCLVQNLSIPLYKIHQDLIIIDCDPQRTTSDWAHERNNRSGLNDIKCIQMYGNILSNLEHIKNKYKVILIDCGGQDTKALRSALLTCTHAIFPIRPKRRDLRTLPHLEELVSEAKINNKDIKYTMVINQAPTLPSQAKRIIEAKDVCKDWNLPCLNTTLCYRNIYDDSEELGLSVIELEPEGKASIEIYSLINEFLTIK